MEHTLDGKDNYIRYAKIISTLNKCNQILNKNSNEKMFKSAIMELLTILEIEKKYNEEEYDCAINKIYALKGET